MAESLQRRPLTTASALYLLVVLVAAVAFAEPQEAPRALAAPAVNILRGVRLLSLAVTVFFALPLLATLEALLERGHDLWLAPLHTLRRLLMVLAVAMAASLVLELLLYGRQPAFALGICTLPFWVLAIIGVIVIIIVLANGERLTITLSSSAGTGAVFREVSSGLAGIDVTVTAATDLASDAPVTVVIDKVVVDTAPGQGGNVQTDVTASLTMGGQATTSSNASNSSLGLSFFPGLSEMTVTVTATCAKGHSQTFSRRVRCQK